MRPGDWSDQALSQLVAVEGCPAADGRVVLEGARPLSRFEAAALIRIGWAFVDQGIRLGVGLAEDHLTEQLAPAGQPGEIDTRPYVPGLPGVEEGEGIAAQLQVDPAQSLR